MTQAAETLFPSQFAEFERFADWALATEGERYAKRLASTLEELETFYRTVEPRIPEVIDYLNQFDLNAMPNDALQLLRTMYSIVVVSWAVEVWRGPQVPDTEQTYLECYREPAV
jgi:hypothetical protein